MAPSVRSIGAVAASGNAVVVGLPAGHTVGDILLLYVESAEPIVTPPTGYAHVPDSPQDSGGTTATATQLSVLWKRDNGSETAPTVADTGNHQLARIIAVSGCVTSGDPWDVTAGSVDIAATTAVSIPGDTTTIDECLILAASSANLPDADTTTEFGTPTNASLTSLTEEIDNTTLAGNGGALHVVSGVKETAGIVSATTCTAVTDPDRRAYHFLALKPALIGVLFVKAPTFFIGDVSAADTDQTLTGNLFVKAPTFFQGVVRRSVPPALTTDEIGVIGYSNTDIFIQYYRTMSTADLLTTINHGGIDIETWGDPADPDYAAAWTKLFNEEPPGGYRGFLVMLAYTDTYTMPEMEGWADHVYTRLVTDFPTIGYIWWMPMATYFSTAGLDGDAEDLVAIDRWGANPLSLDEHPSAEPGVVQGSEWSWTITQYAIANGYADDYGPWINLHESITDTDGRHASEASGGFPPPNGQTHGGDILFAFFENGAQGLTLPNVFVKAPTFFTGTVTLGAVDLAGVLYVNTPTFFTGAVDLSAGTQTVTGVLFVKAPTFPTGTVFKSVSQVPSATVSNDGWDTAPLAGQSIHTYIATDDADYITVTVP